MVSRECDTSSLRCENVLLAGSCSRNFGHHRRALRFLLFEREGSGTQSWRVALGDEAQLAGSRVPDVLPIPGA